VDGKPHGLYQEWSLDGTLAVEAHFEHGQHYGEYKSWWENGQLKEEGTYQNDGQRVGRYRWYKTNGEVWSERDYGTPPAPARGAAKRER
jgi:antitoxin component YwqK of YwqJK toxin-antitoxin module